VVCRALGFVGVDALNDWQLCLRIAMAAMFLVTASAHFNAMRADLIRMVPPQFPKPELLVTITGILEIAGAIGLLYPPTVRLAAICLALLMLAMFPANASAARRKLTLRGKPVTALGLRSVIQVIFVVLVLLAGFGGNRTTP
jgi:uncharacterized membrane protein